MNIRSIGFISCVLLSLLPFPAAAVLHAETEGIPPHEADIDLNLRTVQLLQADTTVTAVAVAPADWLDDNGSPFRTISFSGTDSQGIKLSGGIFFMNGVTTDVHIDRYQPPLRKGDYNMSPSTGGAFTGIDPATSLQAAMTVDTVTREVTVDEQGYTLENFIVDSGDWQETDLGSFTSITFLYSQGDLTITAGLLLGDGVSFGWLKTRQGNASTASYDMTVLSQSHDPVAVDDSVATDEDNAMTVQVLANDNDVDGDDLTVSAVTQPANGVAAVATDNLSIIYTPTENFNGEDSFGYTVNDGNGGTDTASVTVTVNPVNDTPVIGGVDNVGNYIENGPAVVIDPEIEISDVDGSQLNQATVSITANFSGSEDELVYSAVNGIAGSYNSSTGLLTLSGVASLAEYGQAMESVQYRNLSDGPNAATRTVSFIVRDTGNISSTASSTTLTVTPVNDAPAVSGLDNVAGFVEDGGPVIIDNSISITDIDSTQLNQATVSITGNFNSGEDELVYSTVNGIGGSYDSGSGVLTLSGIATLPEYEEALESVQYNNASDTPDTAMRTISSAVRDADDVSSAAVTTTLTVASANDAPEVAITQPADESEFGTNDTITFSATATDPEDGDLGSSIVWTSSIDGALGTGASIQVGLTEGNHTVTASVTDFGSLPDSAVINITVSLPGSNNSPVAVDDSATTTEDFPVGVNLLSNDLDVDEDELSILSVDSVSTQGGTVINAGGGGVAYIPPANFNGQDTFDYVVTDGIGGTDTGTAMVTVTAVNDIPQPVDDNATTDGNSPVVIDVLANDVDVDGDGLFVVSVDDSFTFHGTVEIAPDGKSVIYTPNADASDSSHFISADGFSYIVGDGTGQSAFPGGVTVNVDIEESGLREVFLDNYDNFVIGPLSAGLNFPRAGSNTLDPASACQGSSLAKDVSVEIDYFTQPPSQDPERVVSAVVLSVSEVNYGQQNITQADRVARDLNDDQLKLFSFYRCEMFRTDEYDVGGSTQEFSGISVYSVYALNVDVDLQPGGVQAVLGPDYVETGKNNGEPAVCPVGNPINVATGNKYQVEVDYQSPVSGLLTFARYYNSQDISPFGEVGNNWRTSFDARIRVIEGDDNRAIVVRPSGKTFVFFRDGSGNWTSDNDVTGRLSETLVAGQRVGWTFVTENDLTESYSADGLLYLVTDLAGFTLNLSYDMQNRLEDVTGPYGRQLQFTYDDEDRIQTMTDPDGGVFIYEYSTDGHNNLVKVNYPDDTPGSSTDNPVREYHYEDTDFPNALTGITDENQDRFATWAYDDEGRAIMSEHAGGAERVDLVFNGDGTTTATDALGASRTYSFTNRYGVRRNTDIVGDDCTACGGLFSSRTYDANGFPDTATDFKGFVTDYTFNSRGLEESRTEALGQTEQRTITTQWHTNFRRPTLVTEPRRSIEYDYDGVTGLVESITITDIDTGSPDYLKEYVTTFTYYQTGPNQNRLETVNGPRTDVADVTTYRYDAVGNLIEIENAAGHLIEFTSYDAHGRPLTMEDPNDVVTTLTYDALGRLKTSTVNSTAMTSFDYDQAGQVTKITQPDGSFLEYVYDEVHRLERIEDNLGNYIEYTLDEMGNREAEEVYDSLNNLKKTWTAVYDTLGRLEELTGASSQTTVYGYDDNNNLTSITDPRLYQTVRAFDALNRLKTITDPNGETTYGGITEFGYDTQDMLTSVEDARGLATTYTYNGLGELKTLISPDTGTTTYTYDSAGNRASKTDANSVTVSYTYDELNRLETVNPPGATDDITYVYDTCTLGIGRLCSVTQNGITVSYTYDVFGNIAAAKQEIAGAPPVEVDTDYNYDTDNRLDNIVYPSGMVVEYSYDSLGRISSIALDDGVSTTPLIENITYQPFGPVNAYEQGNGVDIDMTYDQDGRIDTLNDNGSVLDLDYAYDAAGNVQSVANAITSALSRIYSYDPLNRLTEETTTGGMPQTLFDYDHDQVGNRTGYEDTALTLVQEHEYQTGNRLTKFDGVTVVSDNNGNITDLRNLDLSYDVHNRLASATVSSNTTTYKYNGHGERVTKSSTSGMVHYYYGADRQLLAEYDDSGNVEREYVYFNGQPVVMLDHSGMSLGIYWIHNDHLGRPLALTNNSGTVVWRWLNGDAFGNAADIDEDPDNDTNDIVFNLRFPGQYFDTETGLNYNWNRHYDPVTGRYITSDPVGFWGGLNTYSYVNQNPIRYIDPLGLFQFGERPLSGTPTRIPLGNSNVGLMHEQGFYDNGGNVGFFPTGIGQDDPANLNDYTRTGPFYDDAIMRNAEQDLRNSGDWLPDDPNEPWYSNANSDDYDVTLHNCQDFADALRQEYQQLGGGTCQTPFAGGVCNQNP